MREGWWATHKYYKRKCAKEGGDFFGFCGWERLSQTVEEIEEDRQRNLFLSLFFCGARANELLLAKGKNFRVEDETVDVIGLPVFKKIRGKTFEEEYRYRHFPINRKEPLVDGFVSFVRYKPVNERLFKFKYGTLYRLISELEGGDWWPHRLRAERASQLVEDYQANTLMLKGFFEWSRDDTPNFYVKLGMRAWKKVYGVKEPSKGFQASPSTPVGDKKVRREKRKTIERVAVPPPSSGVNNNIIDEGKEKNIYELLLLADKMKKNKLS